MTTELRRDRREKQKRQRHRQEQKKRGSGGITNQLVIGGFVIAAIALGIFGLNAAGVFQPPAAAINLNSAEFQIPTGATIGTKQQLQDAQHIPTGQSGSYNTVPPTSGQHWIQTG